MTAGVDVVPTKHENTTDLAGFFRKFEGQIAIAIGMAQSSNPLLDHPMVEPRPFATRHTRDHILFAFAFVSYAIVMICVARKLDDMASRYAFFLTLAFAAVGSFTMSVFLSPAIA